MSAIAEIAWSVLAGYVGGGVLFVTLSPIARDVREDEQRIRESGGAGWRLLGFGLIVRLGALVHWPVLIPLAIQMYSAERLRRRPGVDFADLSNFMSNMSEGGINDDEFPNGRGRFGYDLSNPIPAHTISGARRYLSRLRYRDNQVVLSERIGSFKSEVSDNPVDRYQLRSEDGEALGTIYISPYQAKTSQRSPDGFKVVV